ncbi:hypothetical protein [Streptomyces sp. NPDC058953]|uniref:hypothetical protein n=1 Tax=unclassified Streptomyces TaxID=2593676 RepID=UPI0036BFCEBC
MRDSIAHAFALVRDLLRFRDRAPGRHSAAYFAGLPAPVPPPYVSPWSRPWTGPTKEQAQEFFRTQAETTPLERGWMR